MTKPWHHLRILFYCFIVLSLLSLDKRNSVSSEHSVYNPTSQVVTSQLVIDSESNIFSSALLLLYSFCPQKSEDTRSLQWGHSTRSWSHVFLHVVSDIVPTLLRTYSNILLRFFLIMLLFSFPILFYLHLHLHLSLLCKLPFFLFFTLIHMSHYSWLNPY